MAFTFTSHGCEISFARYQMMDQMFAESIKVTLKRSVFVLRGSRNRASVLSAWGEQISLPFSLIFSFICSLARVRCNQKTWENNIRCWLLPFTKAMQLFLILFHLFALMTRVASPKTWDWECCSLTFRIACELFKFVSHPDDVLVKTSFAAFVTTTTTTFFYWKCKYFR